MKRSIRPLILIVLSILLLTAGCAASPSAKAPETSSGRGSIAAEAPAAAPVPAMPEEGESAAYDAAAQTERKIIRTAHLVLSVKGIENTVESIKALVNGQDGYVVSSNIWREGEMLRASLQVRVPAEKLDPFLASVRDLAMRVEREETGGQDVTEEYVDLQARLTNLEAAERELRELMTQVRLQGGEAEDIVAVYRELTNVRAQIEQIKGRMQYIDRLSDMATVNLDLREQADVPLDQPGWQPMQTLRRALSTLVQTVKVGVDVLIWIVFYLVPLLIVPALVIVAIWLFTRRRRRAR